MEDRTANPLIGTAWLRRLVLAGVLSVAAVVAREPAAAAAQAAAPVGSGRIPAFSSLPRAAIAYDRGRQALTVDLPSTDLAPSILGAMVMVSSPVYLAVVPASCSVYSGRADVLDSLGAPLPKTFLHHVHLNDPDHRDLFLAGMLHIMAASKETPVIEIPQHLLGLPLTQGQRLLTWAMLSNETATPYRAVHVRVTLGCRPTGQGLLGSLFPLFRAYPWVLDAMFPDGRRAISNRAFELQPGRSAHSWESSPAIPGSIVGIGGHVHDYAVSLQLTDATTGDVLWRVVPVRDSAGRVLELPITKLYNWHRLGVHVVPTHRYRVTVTYDNPTGHTIPDGGMGSVAGLFIPDRGTTWPAVEPANPVYQQDLLELFPGGPAPSMSGMGATSSTTAVTVIPPPDSARRSARPP